jgi:glycosidase
MLDACLDFPLHGVLEEVIKGAASPKKLRERYADFHSYYRNSAEAGRYYVTFLDDHDQSYRPHRRFLHGCDDMRVGILGVTCLLTHIGIPCLYYGTEQGFDGGGDSDVFVRACMFSEHHPIYQTIARLARIRAAEPALRYGRQHFLETSADGKQFSFSDRAKSLLAYSRNLDSDELVICLNLGTDPCDRWVRLREKSAQGDSAMVDLLGEHPTMEVDGQRDTPAFRVQLPARASAIFKRHTRPAGSL